MNLHPLDVIILISGLISLVFLIATIGALKKFRFFVFFRNSVFLLLFILITSICAILKVANYGYRSLLHEECAATVTIEPAGKQRFVAHVVFPDGETAGFLCEGDQVYVDARILKWHPWLNIIGIHTAYQLDRLGGRYITIEDEQNKPRTIHSLLKNSRIDMFQIRKQWVTLKPFVDAEYGSATFIYADLPAVYKIMVSTSGLLVRKTGETL
jgi:hypothetical protein